MGLPIEGLLGWKWTAAIHPEDVEAMVDKWRFTVASGEPFLHEARVRRAGGEYRCMLHHKAAVSDECGQVVRWYGSSIDIEPFPADARLPRDKIAQLDRLYLAVTEALDQLFEGAGLKAA